MALLTATLVTVGLVTVGTAFACGGSSSPSSARGAGGGEQNLSAAPAAPVDTDDTLAPSPAAAGEIAEAVRTSPFTAEVPPDNYQVTDAKLASSDPSWASAELSPTVPDLDRAEGVLHHTDKGWELVQLGSYEVGCGIAPAAVLDDLGRSGYGWNRRKKGGMIEGE